jgi:hypothetical protein
MESTFFIGLTQNGTTPPFIFVIASGSIND